MNRFFWTLLGMMMSALTAEAAGEIMIKKVQAVATGSCGATCNPVTFTAEFEAVTKKGKEADRDVDHLSVETKVKCDAMIIQNVFTDGFGRVFLNQNQGEICKHDGVFSVVSTVKLYHIAKLIETTDFVHAAP
jgi:hypothetical protein